MINIRLFIKKYGIRLFGIGLAIFLYFGLDIGNISEQVKNADPIYFLLAMISVNAVVILQAWRGYILLGDEKTKLSFSDYTHLYFVTMAASAVLPGRVGAMTQVPLLHQCGVGTGAGFANMLYDKLSDLAGFLAMGALFSTILATSELGIKPGPFIILSLIALVLIWYIDVLLAYSSHQIKRLLPKISQSWNCFEMTINPQTKLYVLFLTLIRLIGAVIVHWFCAHAAGLAPSLVQVGAATAFGALSTLVPVTVMGLGVREGVFLLLFSGSNFPKEQILTFAFLLLLAYLSTVVIGTILAVIAKKKDGRMRATEMGPNPER